MSELKQFIINVLDGRNSIINKISSDFNKKEQFQKIIDHLCLTEETFEPTLKRLAKSLLLKNNGHLTVLLLFSMELDSFYSLNSSWYKRDMLIETLYDILLDRKRMEEEYSFWEYMLILFICSLLIMII